MPRPSSNPWDLPPCKKADAAAIQALRRGEAAPDQQLRALEYLIETVCGKDELSFRPGDVGGRRATDFSEGKRWVGLQIVRLAKIPLDKLEE